MSVITMLFVAWIAYSAFRGYRRGLWVTLLSLLGFVAAYATSFLWGQDVANALRGWGFVPSVAYSVAFVGIYFLVYLCVAELPRVFFKAGFARVSRLVVPGAVLGGTVGILSGLVFVWAFGLMQAALNIKGGAAEGEPEALLEMTPAPVEKLARKVMSEASRFGAQAAGASPLQAQMVAKFAAAPEKSLQDIHQISQSPELQGFITSAETQRYMNERNLHGLIESPAFQQLITMPALADMRQLAVDEARSANSDAGLREGDMYIAAQLTHAWRRMNDMRNDPRVKGVLEDSEIKALIEKRDIAGLMMHKKVQVLMGVVMEGGAAAAVDDVTRVDGRDTESVGETLESIPAATPEPQRLYQWRDASGKVRFSDKSPDDPTIEIIEYEG